MSDAETRALGRAAAILLIASTVRWGWGAVRASGGPPLAEETPGLLAESRVLAADRQARERPLGLSERIDPNRATAAELDRLPGLGASTAAAVVASRERDGPFRRPEDLTRVRGLGAATLERIRPHLDLSDPPGGRPMPPRQAGESARAVPGLLAERPAPAGAAGTVRKLDLNRATEAELVTLPGIGPALARRIVEARGERPFGSTAELVRVRGIGPATLARLEPLVVVGR